MSTAKKVPYTILSMQPIGTLEFFTYRSEFDISKTAKIKDVYWRDDKSPQGAGPFNSLNEAMSHHATVHQMRLIPPPAVIVTKAGQVIEIDFKQRKRVK